MLSFKDTPRSQYGDTLPPDQLLAEVCDIQTLDTPQGMRIGYTLLNRHLFEDSVPVVSIGGFLADLTTPERAWEGVQLAALGRPVLMMDMPGHGFSSPHTLKQSVELSLRRRTDSQAKPFVNAVQQIFGKERVIEYFGISHGAHLALKATELESNDRVRAIYGVDIPAVKKRLSLGLNIGMMLNNTIGRKRYLTALRDTEYEKDFERFKQLFEEKGPERARWPGRNNLGLFIVNIFMSVNASNDGLKTMRKVLTRKNTIIYAMTSQKGTVSSPNAINKVIDSLPKTEKHRVEQIVFDNENHNIGLPYLLPRAVAWVKSKQKSS